MPTRPRFCKHLWILALLLIVAMPRSARAGMDSWTPFGPSAAPLQSLAASSRGELYVTASFDLTEIWQLPLTTVPWRWRNNGLGQPLVTALAVDPKNPSSLWAASGTPAFAVESIYHSNDGGGSWTTVFTGDLDFQVAHLWVVQAKKSVVLLAETGNGAPQRLFRSANGGVSWTPVQGALGPVAAPPDEPNVVFASSEDGLSVLRSTDGALTFHSTGSLPTDGDFLRALHATYGRGANVFASFESSGLFRSTDQGGHWSQVGFLHAGPSALASEPKMPSTIYATNFAGLFASQKNGKSGSFRALATFVPPQPIIPQPTALAAAPGGPYFLAGPDLYRYSPKATHGFAAVAKTGIESFGVAELRFHAADPSLLAVREYTGCIRDSCDFRTYLSSDGGKTFQRLGAPLSPNVFEDVSDFAFDPVSTQRWLMAMGGNAVLSENGATRTVLPGPVTAVEISAGGILLAGGANGVQASQDDGATWQTTLSNTLPVSPDHPLGGGRRIVDLVVNPFAQERVVAAALETITPSVPIPPPSSPALYYSSDAGLTWMKILDGSASVAFVAGSPASLYLLESMAGGTELLRSDDGGTTTQLIYTFADSVGVDDIATDPSAPQDLYVATGGSGVLQSHDGGGTWAPTPGDFNAWGNYRLAAFLVQVHPTERGHLFAAPGAGGLFENQLTN